MSAAAGIGDSRTLPLAAMPTPSAIRMTSPSVSMLPTYAAASTPQGSASNRPKSSGLLALRRGERSLQQIFADDRRRERKPTYQHTPSAVIPQTASSVGGMTFRNATNADTTLIP